MIDVHDVAARFTALIQRFPHRQWPEITDLPITALNLMTVTVQQAGFEASAVVPGKLRGHYLEQDGGRTGETYGINGWCAFKVLDPDGRDHFAATAWLDQMVCFIIQGGRAQLEGEALVEAVVREIERSRPLPPIQLTAEGDILCEYPPQGTGLVDHQRDNHQFSVCVHGICRGWMDRQKATPTLDALVCRSCHCSFRFPRELKTYGELRQYLSEKLGLVPSAT